LTRSLRKSDNAVVAAVAAAAAIPVAADAVVAV